MDWNSRTTTEWDWDNLGFSTKTVDASKHVQNHEIERDNGSVYSSGGICFSSSDLGHGSSSKSSISASCDSSLREGIRTYRSSDGLSKDFSHNELTQFDGAGNFPPPTRASASFGEPMIGLKLGKRTYFEDVSQASTSSISGTPISSTATTKRSRANYETALSPRCQVEGCNLDLKMAKDYHRRHRICESHSKSPKVIVAGMERRFCQQCSRFHELSEFDDKKRSCRRRLSDHNARRRRPQPETIQFNSARMSSSLYDGRQQMNVVFNRVPLPAANPVWESACNFKDTQAEDCLIRPAKAGGIYRQMNLPLNVMPDATSMLQIRAEKVLSFEGSTPQVFSQALEASPFASDLDVAPDLQRALSLLSTNSWGLNKHEPTSLDPFMLENQTLVAQPVSHAELQNWTVVSAEHDQGDQSQSEPRVHSNLHDSRSIHFQEFQLFKAPYDPGCFYSSQIN